MPINIQQLQQFHGDMISKEGSHEGYAAGTPRSTFRRLRNGLGGLLGIQHKHGSKVDRIVPDPRQG